ncbi:TPA: hypothetical protein QFH18_002625 [Enterococcus faecium]|nr:hypothetical protein [Enterococcus faecium]EME8168462.1 hypothetical protein [Enterococcus faecium]
MKKNSLFYGTLATTFITIGSAMMPITALASEIKPAISQDTTSDTKSDIQQQFNLNDNLTIKKNKKENIFRNVSYSINYIGYFRERSWAIIM